VPQFVRSEFEAYLACGILERGFLLAQCESCGCKWPVGFSCKKRGFCPSCLGRRMSESAAYFADHLFAKVPVRQWVLSVPPPLRYLLGYDADACAKVFGLFVAAIFAWLHATAKRKLGLKGVFLVALSGYALPEDLERSSAAGFDRHLAKPPRLEKLEQLLADALT
jgi:hypothetical protein